MKKILFTILIASAAACGSSSKTTKTEPAPMPMPDKPAPVVTPAPTPEPAPAPTPAPAPKHAKAVLAPTKGSKVMGTIEFAEVDGGVEVTANVAGLKAGEHGFHVHEKGDCSAPDAKSAGGHFNPGGHDHGAPDAAMHHEGDFGNLTAGKDGKATKTFTMKGITLGTDMMSIIGKGFIVHAMGDDLKTQPTGNAGARVACGVIELITND